MWKQFKFKRALLTILLLYLSAVNEMPKVVVKSIIKKGKKLLTSKLSR